MLVFHIYVPFTQMSRLLFEMKAMAFNVHLKIERKDDAASRLLGIFIFIQFHDHFCRI